MKSIVRIAFALLVMLSVGACNAQMPTTSAAPTVAPTAAEVVLDANGYPAPAITGNQAGYPAPEGSAAEVQPGMDVPVPPADAPVPEAGMGSISGILYSFTIKMTLPGTDFYLSSGWGDSRKDPPAAFLGPQPEKGDIELRTDETGAFSASNIPPGFYYLAVFAPLNWAASVMSPEDSTMRLIEIKADEKTPLGVVYVSWP
jgi:hypothetical protein